VEAFVWDDRFRTGIDLVDEQHQSLVAIVNRVGDLLIAAQPAGQAAIEAIFRDLADYANTHFRDEERLMREAGVAAGHFDHHVKIHRDFIAQIQAMWRARATMRAPAETLHGFLAAWLSFHILGEDMAMAREIERIRAGMPPAEAHRLETEPDAAGPATALLRALRNLYGVLAHMNHDLADANQRLEADVAVRTSELTEANRRLENERRELQALLAKVNQAQSQLLQSEKMASIGQLAAGVAHEINNPIGFVNSNLGTLGHYVDDLLRFATLGAATPEGQALQRQVDLDYLRGDVGDLLRESRDGLDRVRKIIADLKDFSRVDQAEWQEADLLAGLESTLNVVWHELKYKAEIVRELQPLPLVRCVPAQINQVFLNLLVNAAQAIPAQGKITLRSGQDGERVWIEVADDGCGMDETTRRRIFEPFFTTKPVGSGTGLGMSVSWDIVRKHDGTLDVQSAPGVGTRVRIVLPCAGPAATPGS
jgi:hemerythrin-like metal-binding protein